MARILRFGAAAARGNLRGPSSSVPSRKFAIRNFRGAANALGFLVVARECSFYRFVFLIWKVSNTAAELLYSTKVPASRITTGCYLS